MILSVAKNEGNVGSSYFVYNSQNFVFEIRVKILITFSRESEFV